MSVLLELQRTKDGTPGRLLLKCPYSDKDVAKRVGHGAASWSKTKNRWSYPVDPAVVRNAIRYFPGIEIYPGVQDYLDRMREKQERLWAVVEHTEPLLPNDRLWPFQRASVRFLLEAGRTILGHDMGTGKTPITCAALEVLGAGRVLIVCPNTVKWSWVDHTREWAKREDIFVLGVDKKVEDQAVSLISGGPTARNNELQEMLHQGNHFVLVTNYDQARIHRSILAKYDWDVVIVDEAHRIKDPKALRSQAIKEIAKNAPYVWLLTGTPYRSSYSDFFGLLTLCDPERFTSYWNFVRLHLDSVPGTFGGMDIVGPRNQEMFNAMLSTYMYRKTKKEVLPDLPDKIYVDHRLDMNEKQAKAYKQMEKKFLLHIQKELKDGRTIESILYAPETVAQIIRLRQICLTPAILGGVADSAKIDALEELLEDLLTGGKRVIIYSCFKKFLPYVGRILKDLWVPFGEIVGGQSSIERRKVEQGLNNGSIKAVLGTIQAMGEGLNLQAADTAIFCDTDWVPAVNEQAEDRIHRMGVKSSPTIISLYHPGTVEADIRAVCKRKTRASDETVGRVESIREMLRRKEV